MKWRAFWDCPEELFVGAFLQFPLYFIIGWKIFALMAITALLWRWGGVEGGVKWARWAIVPLLVCLSAYLTTHTWQIFLAAPFMVKLAPSYGEQSWLFKLLKNDFLTRLVCFAWYWAAFSIGYTLG